MMPLLRVLRETQPAVSLCCRVVGGFDTLTAMENVESDPKTDRPKEEVRICTTTVFVDPYEEADAQVRKVPSKSWPCWLGAGGHIRRLWISLCPPS